MAITYKIKYAVNIAGREYTRETTLVSSANSVPDAIARFKTQLPAEQGQTFALINCSAKRTNGLKFKTMAEAYADVDNVKHNEAIARHNAAAALHDAIAAADVAKTLPRFPDVWQLIDVPDTKWEPDKTGISVIINWILPADIVRIDLIAADNVPIVSFQGGTDNVRKHCLQWLALNVPAFGLGHAGYIGAELEKADTERIDYIQN